MNKRIAIYLAFAVLLLFALAPTALAQFTPDVFVLDQPIEDGMVTVSRAVINEPGWMVIHADEDGAPGPVIGFAPLETGINAQVDVKIDTESATRILYAMLHVDEGEAGVYEFPGPDVPVLVNEAPVSPPFIVTGVEDAEADEAEADEAEADEADEAEAEEPAAEEDAAGAADIVDTASAAGNFQILLAAVQEAGLEETLRSEGPFTVFAPTDEAFSELEEGMLDALLEDTETLTQILLFHVIPGAVRSGDLSDGLEAETAQGSTVTFSVTEDGAMVEDANIVQTDIEATNGVIHVIDTVLLPPLDEEVEAAEADEAMEDEAMADEAAEEAPAQEEPMDDIMTIAQANEAFSTLVDALIAAELVGTLQGDGPFTVFAPTNDAFGALSDSTLDELLNDTNALRNVLLYHVVPGRIFAADLSDGQVAETAQGATVTFSVSEEGVMVNDANVIVADIEAANGIIHVIDQVLIPPDDGAMADEEMADEEMADEEMADEEMADEEMADEEMADEEMADEEMADEPTGTAVIPPAQPEEMPATGISLSSNPGTFGTVTLVLLALVGIAYVGRRKQS